MRVFIPREICLLAIASLFFSNCAFAQESSALINRALDEQFKLNLEKETPLPKVLEEIGKQTDVRIKEDPIIWDLLPWGRDTAVKMKMENVTLRTGLTVMTRKLGLTMALRDEFVEIIPMPALKRLGQRAGRDELRALDLLATRPLNLDTDHPTIKHLLEAIDLKLAEEKDVQVAIENRIGDTVKQDSTVFVPRNATLMDALESLPKETKATWYPWGKSIVVSTKEERTRRMLSKPLTMRPGENGVDLMQVLLEISTRTGVPFDFQPGIVQAVPAEARTIRGVMENAPAQQILEAISATTGLQYTIQDDKVYISATAGVAPIANAAPRDPPIGFIQLDIGMQVLVPVSQVPPDLREFIKYKTEKELAKMRKMMEEEKFKPGAAEEKPQP